MFISLLDSLGTFRRGGGERQIHPYRNEENADHNSMLNWAGQTIACIYTRGFELTPRLIVTTPFR